MEWDQGRGWGNFSTWSPPGFCSICLYPFWCSLPNMHDQQMVSKHDPQALGQGIIDDGEERGRWQKFLGECGLYSGAWLQNVSLTNLAVDEASECNVWMLLGMLFYFSPPYGWTFLSRAWGLFTYCNWLAEAKACMWLHFNHTLSLVRELNWSGTFTKSYLFPWQLSMVTEEQRALTQDTSCHIHSKEQSH